ncbi:hypothetical protein AKJ39_00165 [candidate division MSBL1 archaeon SCGC-AAA259J03]|uniref:Amidohydrolase-related domain-containing protein n=1 Tax=candidate division MSBL1 archaeon SCGC-AAA259J03 TaxID=1698269 RepID=A0A656YXF9_9EURY|nr:hypothetical protein AKJ39_00165 [candidate division MSBL1 archaeon SCGC-AAA259J03]
MTSGNLTVEDGLIKDISKTNLPAGNHVIDADGGLVIPGVIDAHAHFYDPKFSQREDFENGSKAAAAGGVTTIFSMPLDSPILKPEEVEKTIKAGEKNSIIDFSLHAGNMTKNSSQYISRIVKMGIKTFKLFTSPPYALERNDRRRIMRAIDQERGISFIHAEDREIIREKTEKLKNAGRKDPSAHAEARPNEAEEKAVREIITDQKKIGNHIHFAHLSTRQATQLVKNAKTSEEKISAETCPHFLVFTQEDLEKKGPYLRTNPSLKSKKDVAALWKALSTGTIDMVTTDHAPGTREEKEVGKNNIWKSQIGIPGVETLLPIMFSEGVNEGRITLNRLVDLLCVAPARRFGIYPKKGCIKEGTDADLVIIDQKKKMKIKNKNIHYKVGWTPYDGMEIQGVPVFTISRGEVIAREGKIQDEPGRGRFLPVSD